MDFFTNLAARAVRVESQVALGCLVAESLADLTRDRATAAPFLKKHPWIRAPSWTLQVTKEAQTMIAGAGIRIADLRDLTPTNEELAEILADPSIAGAYLLHPDPRRLSWRLVLKTDAIRLLHAHGLVQLEKRAGRFARKELFGPLRPFEWLRSRSLFNWLEILAVLATLITTTVLILTDLNVH